MKVNEFGVVVSGNNVKKRGEIGKPGQAFSTFLSALNDTSDTPQAVPAGDIGATTALVNMLALQEISEEDIQRRKQYQHGKQLLDMLDQLRQQLLMGAVPLSSMQQIGRQLEIVKQRVTDPGLGALIEDIELLAAVELAKLEKAKEQQAYR